MNEVVNSSPVNTLAFLAKEANVLSDLLLDSQGELTPELEAWYDAHSQALTRKVDSYVFIEESLDDQVERWKARAEAARTIAKRFESFKDKLRDRVKFAMKEMGVDTLEGDLYRYKLSKRKAKLVIEDPAKIPDSFKLIVTVTEPDKDKIQSALNDGFTVPGARLEPVTALLPQQKVKK